MPNFQQIQIPDSSNFNRERAIELANLIMVAYDEYEIWDQHGDQLGPPNEETILGSSALVDMKNYQESTDNVYGRINESWGQEQLKYKRLINFWYTQFSLGDFLEDIQNKENSLLNDVRDGINKLFRKMGFDKLPDSTSLSTGFRDQVFGFIAQRQLEDGTNGLFLVFRGTREPAEWFNNFRVGPDPFLEDDSLGKVRDGFYRIYSNQQGKRPTICKAIEDFFTQMSPVDQRKTHIFITGHSLGAALANLAAAHLVNKFNLNPILYTFASPRVGDKKFTDQIAKLEETYRIINSEDLIQAVPLPTTSILDDEMLEGSSFKQYVQEFRGHVTQFTKGLSGMTYQHVGIPVVFTRQTGTVAGNHNLASTYREALAED